jgi:nitroreductase
MELMAVIRNRCAVRNYTDAPIDRPTVERLIDAAILAPSAMNLQPWAFAVLLGRERIETYAKRAKDWLLASLSQTSYEPSIRHMLERSTICPVLSSSLTSNCPGQIRGRPGCRRIPPLLSNRESPMRAGTLASVTYVTANQLNGF